MQDTQASGVWVSKQGHLVVAANQLTDEEGVSLTHSYSLWGKLPFLSPAQSLPLRSGTSVQGAGWSLLLHKCRPSSGVLQGSTLTPCRIIWGALKETNIQAPPLDPLDVVPRDFKSSF